MAKRLIKWIEHGELLGHLVTDQWFQFSDKGTIRYCQPDILLILSDKIIILECKLTQTPIAFAQVRELYKPIMECLFRKPCLTVQACKNLISPPNYLVHDVTELLMDVQDKDYTWYIPTI